MTRQLTARCRHRGFTLIELMVTVAVVAVLLGIAAPSFYDTIKNNRLRTQADRLVTTFNLARSEAVKRNIEVIVCPSSDSDNPTCTGNYAQGWLVFADLDRDGAFDAGVDPVLRVNDGLPAGYTVTGTDGTADYTTKITYYADGSANNDPAAPALYVCPPDKDADAAWRIEVSVVGRSVTSRGSDGGNYSCPS